MFSVGRRPLANSSESLCQGSKHPRLGQRRATWGKVALRRDTAFQPNILASFEEPVPFMHPVVLLGVCVCVTHKRNCHLQHRMPRCLGLGGE